MLRTGALKDGTALDYASGLVISNYKGYKTVAHGGADAGYRSYFLRFPEEHFSVILLANLANINVSSLSKKVADLFLKDKSIQEPVHKPDSSILKRWAGDYFDKQIQSITRLDFKNEKLLAGSTELIASDDSTFNAQSSTFTFSGNSTNTMLEFSTKGSGTQTYNKVKKIKLSTSNLQEYKGDFYSPELDTKYRLSVKDSSLQIKIPRHDEIKLSPFIKDIFADDIVIRFTRNKKNNIDGFFLSTDRVRNLYFQKIVIK